MNARLNTLLALILCTICISILSCKKGDSNGPSTADKLIGTWKAADQVPSQLDIYRFNADGNGTDTRTLGSQSPFVVEFTWSVDDKNVLNIDTKNWTQGKPSATIDGAYQIESLDDSLLVVQSIIDPTYPTREFVRQ